MPPLVKVDEDLSEEVAEISTAAGYEAITVRSQGWAGLLDDELWLRVRAEHRWLITADKAFGDICKLVRQLSDIFPNSSHAAFEGLIMSPDVE